nr:MAG TPA: hypothetical protein [Ackermannviridae sp.]
MADNGGIKPLTFIPLFRYQFRRLMWRRCPLKVK